MDSSGSELRTVWISLQSGNKIFGSIESQKYLDHLSNDFLLKENSAQWS